MNLFFLAIAPVIAIILYIYVKDTYEKEPVILLFKNFVYGATASVFITTILGGALSKIFVVTDSSNIIQTLIKAFIVVGLVEELSKYFVVRYYSQSHKEFNEPFDGIVYAVMVSMGFATIENILYVYKFGAQTGIIRAFTAVPAHATFAILMGYYMGKAKFSIHRKKLNILGLLAATFFHGTYDFFLFINYKPGISGGAFVSLIIGFVLANKAIKNHQKI
ncbi:PrsW family intramembrane metalloprotease [Tenacibaculum sp. IB213877]|uniref:PrsW family intramembrane metalloprotease n=1 Tax=Tenacibaculum sp. IB213877 TaxID=3097351 RepID=UPI002A5AC8C6|nr:PrsW family glutamic-type intramembrane protease [Tenacibaculum sp. IB213877]MDY0780040.1 PrsW family glutamic-type intramembrane protease [Tenacibaculum sp. IB213877]